MAKKFVTLSTKSGRPLKATLRARMKGDAAKFQRGLMKAALFLQGESQRICPVDTSALRNSARTTQEGSGFKTVAKVSYGMYYAVFVHEIPARHAPGTQWKYLEEPARTKEKDMVQIVKSEMKKK